MGWCPPQNPEGDPAALHATPSGRPPAPNAADGSTTSKATTQVVNSSTQRHRPFLLVMCAACMVAHGAACAQQLRAGMQHLHGGGGGGMQNLTLAALELLVLGVLANILLDGWRKRLSEQELTDWCLVLFGLALPYMHVANTLLEPASMEAKTTWPAAMPVMLGFGVLLGQFPPAHSLVQWILSLAAGTFIDCYSRRHKHQQQCAAPGSSFPGLAPCLLTQALILGAAGLAGWATSYVIMTKHFRRLSQHRQPHRGPRGSAPGQGGDSGNNNNNDDNRSGAGGAAAATPLPFETLGVRLLAALGAGAALRRLERWADRAADWISEGFVIRLICVPTGLGYFVFALLCRMQFQNMTFNLTPDQFVVAILAWFMLGRESCSFDILPAMQHIQAQLSASFAKQANRLSVMELVDTVRLQVMGASQSCLASGSLVEASASGDARPEDKIKLLELLGEGMSGKVYRGVWRGTTVAVKSMLLPSNVTGAAKRERMAILEAAICAALSHPNIVQTYTYAIHRVSHAAQPSVETRPISGPETSDAAANWSSAAEEARCRDGGGESSGGDLADCFEVRLVLEFADCGTLREALDRGAFLSRRTSAANVSPSAALTGSSLLASVGGDNRGGDGGGGIRREAEEGGESGLNYRAVLDTAADVAKGMLHLHALNIVHADLKPCNVLLLSSASDPRGFTAKVSDFGLSLKMDESQTHMSNLYHGTPTHQAPEVFMCGHISKAADVYAFGITMWEIYTGERAFKGMVKAMMGLCIAEQGQRPAFPADAPSPYVELASRCWDGAPSARPPFEEIVAVLAELCEEEAIRPPRKQALSAVRASGAAAATDV